MAFCLWIVTGIRPATAQTAVLTASLVPGTWRNAIQVRGDLSAAHRAALTVAEGGIVASVFFQSGQAVAPGQVLLELEDGPEKAQLSLDTAHASQAARNYARTARLIKMAGASDADLQQAATDDAESKAQVEIDLARIAELQIVAPFGGLVGLRTVDPGDYLQPGQEVTTLVAPGPIRVFFSVPQSEMGDVAVGDHFDVTALVGKQAPCDAAGHVTVLSPEIDDATDARNVEGQIDDGTCPLLPGASVVVDMATGEPVPAFSVPSTALNDSSLGPFVYVLVKSSNQLVLRAVYVKIYGTRGDQTLISTNNLSAEGKIVRIGGFNLSDGQSVVADGT